MSREIKFRAWDGEEMFDVNVLALAECGWSCDKGRGVSIPYQPSIVVMQYTGLKDKNGVEEYEGDILGLEDAGDASKCVVIFHEGAFKRSYLPFLTKEKKSHPDFFEKDYIHHFDQWDKENWIVIGNIYENSELLNGNNHNS